MYPFQSKLMNLKKSEKVKNKSLAENTWYKSYHWLIYHLPDSSKNHETCQNKNT